MARRCSTLRRILAVWLLLVTAGFGLGEPARAENVDLSTVPTRGSVQLTIYNSEDLTLVRETRVVTFKPGNNPLQFSWAGTLIDPTSVNLKFLTQPDKLTLLDTTFPQAKPQMLYWNVSSELSGEATIEISYFTSGITWTADYVALADKNEQNLRLDGYVRVFNLSGEEYENAQVRLVVGTINLVEKIAQLATPAVTTEKLAEEQTVRLKHDLMKSELRDGIERYDDYGEINGALGDRQVKRKEVMKEGLSEYFIYTIEGTETIKNGWSKRLNSLEAETVPFSVQYRYRPREYGEQLVRMYILANNEEAKLGTTPLPNGMVRVFRDNGKDGLTYVTQQALKYVPIGDKIELNLGADPEVLFELIKLRTYRNNMWLQINGTNELRQIGGDGVKKVENANLVGWDDHEIFTQRIRNYTAKPIEVELRREFAGHVNFRSKLQPTLFDYQTVELKTAVPAGKRADLKFEVLRHQGSNSKQNNITLETAEVQ